MIRLDPHICSIWGIQLHVQIEQHPPVQLCGNLPGRASISHCLVKTSNQLSKTGLIVGKILTILSMRLLFAKNSAKRSPRTSIFSLPLSRKSKRYFHPASFRSSSRLTSPRASNARPVRFPAKRGPKRNLSSFFVASARSSTRRT